MTVPTLAPARWLVTGGTGFLGLHLCRYLRSLGHEVVSFDIAAMPADEQIPGVTEIRGDIREPAQLEAAVAGCDYVAHCAAALALARPEEITAVNVGGTRNLLEACARHRVKRLVYISSTAVYGMPKFHPIFEDAPLDPMGDYGVSKAAAERACLGQSAVPAMVIRPKSFIGTGRLGIFQILFDWIECGKRIYVLGNGRNRFQLLAVDDLVNAIVLAVERGRAGQVYNVGAARYGTVNEDVGALLAHAHTGSRIAHIPSGPAKLALGLLERLHLSPVYRWVYDTADQDSYVSIDKAQRELGWQPDFSNAETMIRTYDWYLEKGKILAQATGTSHRVAWKQGALKILKAFS
ncbi:MAG TPA: NAD-dependent epimerase/dehydratase family protein [Lacunisphaera sp.]|nr:NAD-dependent epimerase/dehydratase family protein [Lacunisphaera sp.]